MKRRSLEVLGPEVTVQYSSKFDDGFDYKCYYSVSTNQSVISAGELYIDDLRRIRKYFKSKYNNIVKFDNLGKPEGQYSYKNYWCKCEKLWFDYEQKINGFKEIF